MKLCENTRAANCKKDSKINEPSYFKEEGNDEYKYSEAAARAIEIRLNKQISEHNKYLLSEEREERAYRASSLGLIIDNRATAFYSPAKHLFVKLDICYKGRLGIAGKGIPIQGKRDMLISLPDSPPAKIYGVLYYSII
jgi:hypothetical protein